MQTTDTPVIVEETYKTSIENVWNALTEPNQMKKWFFEQIEDFQAKVGFKTQFIVTVEDRKFTHLWEITEVTPNQKIKYNWRYPEYPGDSFVTFELSKEKNGTTLTLTTEVTESFPSNIPEFNRESCLEGWNYFIKKSLKEYLE